MKFSVIIPVYNRSKLVKRALLSVLNQTEPAAEIIIIDDGSTDETPQTLKKFVGDAQIITQKNSGVSAARNAGLKQAAGEWIAFLDSDDEWLPDKLKMATEFIEKHPQYKIFQSEEIWIRNGKRVNPKDKHQKLGGWIFKESLPLCIVSPSAVVIHRDVFEKVGTFDESLLVCEDYDLWLRIARRFPIGLDPEPGIFKYGGHEDQLSRKYWGMDHYRALAIEKHIKDPTLPDDLHREALKVMRQKLNILITGAEKRGKNASVYRKKLKLYQIT